MSQVQKNEQAAGSRLGPNDYLRRYEEAYARFVRAVAAAKLAKRQDNRKEE